MAERLAYLEAVVGADITEFRKSMRDIRNDVGILSETITGIGGAARTMTFAFTAPMVALGTYAVQAASGFDAAMRNINSLLGLGEAEFSAFEATVLDFAETTRSGVIPATEALYEIFSAGITDQERALEVWQISAKVAEAGLADLDKTTNAITATMSAFNLETDQASHVGNVWSRMVQLGVGSLSDFLSNSQKVLPLSSALNVSLEDMGATLAFLSQGGGGAAKAETAYAMMLSNMLKPTIEMKSALQELGVASGTDLVEKFGSVSEAVMALRGVTDEVTFNNLFSKTGLEAALRITGNIDAMRQATLDFNDSLDTATMSAWEQQSKSFAFQWDRMKTSLESTAISIGQAIIPLITPLIAGFSDFLGLVNDLNPEIVQLGVIFVGVVAAGAPLVWLFTSLLNPIGLVLAAVTTLAGAVTTNFGGIRDTIVQAVADITGGLQPLQDAFGIFMDTLFPAVEDIPNADTPILIDVTDRITVTEPKSLWQIYEEQGYADTFTWDAFMEEARKGGWEGGVVDIGDEITITGGDTLGSGVGTQFKESFQEKMNDVFGRSAGMGMSADTVVAEQENIFVRLEAAIGAAWPTLEAALNTMWGNFQTWVTATAIPAVDGAGASILNAISGWFDVSSSNFEGDGATYDVITGALTTDVGGAVSEAGGIFANAFPGIVAGLNTLFESVGNWVIAEGLPTLARSVGFIAGRLASLLGDALSGVWDAISGQGGIAAGAGQVVQTSMLTPLSEGIQEGIGAGGSTNPFDVFLDNIGASLLLAAGAWVIAPGVVSAIAMPIVNAVGGALLSAVMSTRLASGIVSFATSVGVGLTTAFSALSIIGIGAVIVAALLNNEDIQNGLAAWSGVWSNFVTILLNARSTVIGAIQEIRQDVETFFADASLRVANIKLLVNPNDRAAQIEKFKAEGLIQAAAITDQFEYALNSYVDGAVVDFTIPGLQPVLSGEAGADVQEAFKTYFSAGSEFTQALQIALNTQDYSALDVLIPLAINYTAMNNPDLTPGNILNQLVAETGLSPDALALEFSRYYADNPAAIDELVFMIDKIKAQNSPTMVVDTSEITAGDATTGLAPVVDVAVDANLVSQNMAAASQTWADSLVAGMPAAVTLAVTESAGDMNVAATSMTQPFVDAFTTSFSPEGTVTTVWSGFLTGFVTDVTTLQATMTTAMPVIQGAAIGAFNAITGVVNSADAAFRRMQNTLQALTASPYRVVVDIQTNGSLPTGGGAKPDGSHAGGLDSVPFDGYIAELHQGEMVLTEQEASQYRAGNALPTPGNSVSIDQSSPTVNIYGVQDFDQFLAEAKRRGYNLERFRR